MIRILLAHPSRLIGNSLRTALDNQEGLYVVGCATTVEEFHFLLPHANVVLLATHLADATALDLLDEIRLTHSQIRVLVLGLDSQPDHILQYIEAGAVGYILQNESVEDLVNKLHAAHEEKAIVSPSVAAAMMNRLARLANLETPLAFMEARQSHLDELTAREREILHLMADGCTNKEIAGRLVIAHGTVKNHVHNILKKLEVNNRHEAASILQMQEGSVLAVA